MRKWRGPTVNLRYGTQILRANSRRQLDRLHSPVFLFTAPTHRAEVAESFCAGCNRELGQELDEELARTGPTGFFKAAQGIKGRAKHTEVSPFLYRGMSAEQPTQLTMPAPHGEYEILAEAYWHKGRGKTTTSALRQLVFKTSDGQIFCVPFNRAWTAEHVKSAVRERKLEGATLIEIFLGHDEEVLPGLEVRKLLTEPPAPIANPTWQEHDSDRQTRDLRSLGEVFRREG